MAFGVASLEVALHCVSHDLLAPWRIAWLMFCSISILGMVLPLAVVHAGLSRWTEGAIEAFDGLHQLRKK